MSNLFWIQLWGLVWKNLILLSRSPIASLLRCFLLPAAYAFFFGFAQSFFSRLDNLGNGTPSPVLTLESQFSGALTLAWADNTTGSATPTPQQIIDRITANFNPAQHAAIRKVPTALDLPAACPGNYDHISLCFAGISFNSLPGRGGSVDYTLLVDRGLEKIDVQGQRSDYQARMLPLQWAIDKAVVELQTGVEQETPLEWIYTRETNEEQKTRVRLSFVNGLRDIVGLGLFMAFLGVVYQLPGAITSERAMLITDHMKAMGLLDSARIISWHVSASLTHLPAWILFSVIWKIRIFVKTSIVIVLLVHIVFGLSLVSWSFFIAAPFGKSPQLAAVVTTCLALILGIFGLVITANGSIIRVIVSIVCPPSMYIFSLKTMASWEKAELSINLIKGDPTFNQVLLPLIIAGVFNIVFWPAASLLLESWLYDVSIPGQRPWFAFWRKESTNGSLPDGMAVSIRNLTKTFKSSRFSSKQDVTAVSDLSLDIPETGIFVLLGSNGAGKSTSLSIIGGLASSTSGTITYTGGVARPARGTLGLVPQKNVLFPGLTCLQTLKVWQAIKWSSNSERDEDLEQLLHDCDLEKKIHAMADSMSGGQKRKLQLAIGLLGGSKIVLVDECTSGVDPLSRRAIWSILSSCQHDRCIVYTTHFLDEADLLGDYVAVLAAPGKVVAQGSPVALKREYGKGYSIQVTFRSSATLVAAEEKLLSTVRRITPKVYTTIPGSNQLCYHLKEKDVNVVRQVLHLLDTRSEGLGIASYDIIGTTLEDVFLDLMHQHDALKLSESNPEKVSLIQDGEKIVSFSLDNGRPVSFLKQALTIFYKRLLILKRSWLTSLLAIAIAVCGSCVPLIFIKDIQQTCVKRYRDILPVPLFINNFPLASLAVYGNETLFVQSPPSLLQTLATAPNASIPGIVDQPNEAAWRGYIADNYRDILAGGISYDASEGSVVYAYEASVNIHGPAMQNLASNLLYRRALNSSGAASAASTATIQTKFGTFPRVVSGRLVPLKWIVFFGAVMAIYPAFFSLYVSRERKVSIQAMQLSNGLNDPLGMWMGHLLFDTMLVVVASTIIIVVFAVVVPKAFAGLGFFWLVLVLYGIAGALLSYVVALFASSPLAAFALVASYQFIVYILYLASYLIVFTFVKQSDVQRVSRIVHFASSVAAPIASVIRAGLIAVNLFSLLCEGANNTNAATLMQLVRFGGPVAYLVAYCFLLVAVLIWWESGTILPRKARAAKTISFGNAYGSREDVAIAAEAASNSDDLLRVLNISKTFGDKTVVDDISLSVGKNTVFALLGPNGAGKTTTFNSIRGEVIPESGDILINGTSVVSHPKLARSSLGVCPQFTAIDSQLTVREHLLVYGRLKGLRPGQELTRNVEAILESTGLTTYADRLASKLSGGNQRKVSLGIALMGNPPVLLIDEFSTGVDAKMKREMWHTLRQVAVGKAVVITTHSMEEASALANGVGIIAKRVLAVGTTQSLSDRFANYEVHFTCRSRDDVVKARSLMATIPGSRMADDVATRFEVPITPGGLTLADLFGKLADSGAFEEYTVEKAGLESIFLKVVRGANVREEDTQRASKPWWRIV